MSSSRLLLDVPQLVKLMRIQKKYNIKEIYKKVLYSSDILEKCVLSRFYFKPQSTYIEKIIKSNLEIEDPVDEISGDGHKNGINYEIKTSLHDKNCKFNFVQIRPDHNIDFYIFLGLNIFEKDDDYKCYLFKIPSNNVYDLVIKYGDYAHGTIKRNGIITKDNFKGRNKEYCLRPNPNSKKSSKSYKLFEEMLKFQTLYDKNLF
mgnify:FL=1